MSQRILLKTTIPTTEDDWHIGRFSLLAAHLENCTDASGSRHDVAARDRIEADGDDVDLIAAARGEFDQIWLFGVDVTNALSDNDVENLRTFRAGGGGLFLTRDHQDLGACLSRIAEIGPSQYFQTANPEPDAARHCIDDVDTPDITWPNYHSGANGDLQRVTVLDPVHPLMQRAAGEPIERLPCHPHEGCVGVPPGMEATARVVATGVSQTSGAAFNLCVAIDEPGQGRAVSDSSFHHLCDFNWNPKLGCPSFVSETPGSTVIDDPHALDDVRAYVANAARWIARL